jgi:ArsR family transcriptional regulator
LSCDPIKVFKALSDENRLHILAVLNDSPSGVCALAKKLNLTQPTLSHHIKILHDADLVIMEKEGQCKNCQINLQTLADLGIDLAKILKEN